MAGCNDCWCEHYDKSKGNCNQCIKKEIDRNKLDLNIILKQRAVKQMESPSEDSRVLDKRRKIKGQTR